MISASVISKIFNATCALGVAKDRNPDFLKYSRDTFEIWGTGFLVKRRNAIMTNRHVAEAIATRLGQLGLDGTHVAAQFTYPYPKGMEQSLVGLAKHVYVANPLIDVGLFEFSRYPDERPNFVAAVNPLSVIENVKDLQLGEPIGVMGFPFDTELLVDSRVDRNTIVRVGPVLQQGFISGFQPWQGVETIMDLLLDVRAYHGMSGAPIFRVESGQVIGMLWGGDAPNAIVCHGVPLDEFRLSAWLPVLDRTEGGAVEVEVRYFDPPAQDGPAA
jgi:hypothetical protein